MSGLSASSRKIVAATAPAVAGNVQKIVGKFYPTMFAKHPEVLQFFNMSNQRRGRQPRALADAVLASVSHLDNLDSIKPALDVIVHKHCALGILPEHYQIVHDNFLAATADVLGEAVTPEVAGAWSDVLMLLAKGLIDMEEATYKAAESRVGGWRGIKDFVVTKAVQETDIVRSLYLAPKDGSPAPEFTPGQYVTVCENPTSDKYFAPRHYTISSDDELRITTKKCTQAGAPDGIMSSFLQTVSEGDTIKLRPPFGTGTIGELFGDDASNVVYISGGSGVTPVRSIAGAAAKGGAAFHSIHAGHNGEHPLRGEIEELRTAVHGSSAVFGDRSLLTPSAITSFVDKAGVDPTTARYYVSGPPNMMQAVGSNLGAIGVPATNIHATTFGPAMSITS